MPHPGRGMAGGKERTLSIRPDDVLSSVRAELVEALRPAQGERFILHRAVAIVKLIVDSTSQRVLDAHRVGDDAAEINL